MATKNAVAAAASTAMAEYDFGDYAGLGFENQTAADMLVPFYGILQGLSPQLETVEGARPGLIINTVTGELFDGKVGVPFVAAHTKHVYTAWKPRNAGGGFVGQFAIDDPMVVEAVKRAAEFGDYKTPDGDELVETYYVTGINPENNEEVVIAFSSTKVKPYKAWMTKARTFQIPGPGGRKINPPLPALTYRLKTVKQKNSQGEFYNWDISFDGASGMDCLNKPTDPVFQRAVELHKAMSDGTKSMDMGAAKAEARSADASRAEEEVPF